MLTNSRLASLIEQQIDCVMYQVANDDWDFENGPDLRKMTKRAMTLAKILGQFDERIKNKLYLEIGLACEAYLNDFVREMGYEPRTKSMLWSRTNALVSWVEEYFDDQDKQDIDDLMMTLWGPENFGKIEEEQMFDLLAGFIVGKMALDRVGHA